MVDQVWVLIRGADLVSNEGHGHSAEGGAQALVVPAEGAGHLCDALGGGESAG